MEEYEEGEEGGSCGGCEHVRRGEGGGRKSPNVSNDVLVMLKSVLRAHILCTIQGECNQKGLLGEL